MLDTGDVVDDELVGEDDGNRRVILFVLEVYKVSFPSLSVIVSVPGELGA
jgi:hypothetical protein